MTKVLLDTSIYVDWLNRGRRPELMLGQGFVRYLSAVVHMELRVGATTRPARRGLDQLVHAYEAGGRLVTPSARMFADAALILQRLHSRGHEIRRASLVHDVLIALTARTLGATLHTTNATDFEAIRNLREFPLQIVTP